MLPTNNALYLQATTACLSTIIVMQIMNVFICRHPSESVFHSGWFGNRLLLLGVVLEIILILLIAYTPLGVCRIGIVSIARMDNYWHIE